MNCNDSTLFRVLALLALLPAAASAQEPFEPRDCVIGPYLVVDVSSAVPGLLEEVTVNRSDTVEAGQLLARLESRVEEASMALADAWASIESEVRIEETTRALDRRRESRISQLYANRAAALDDKDKAETESALASLRLRQAREKRWIRELDAEKAKAVVERRTVRSPIDGVVVERFRTAGEYVENQPVVRIAQLDPLEVETILPMNLFGTISEGMVAEVTPENDALASHRAVVRVVDRLGDAASGTFGVRLTLPNEGNRIPAGLKCSLQFLEGVRAEVPEPDPRTPEPEPRLPQPPAAPALDEFSAPAAVPTVEAAAPAEQPEVSDDTREVPALADSPLFPEQAPWEQIADRSAQGLDQGVDQEPGHGEVAHACVSVGPVASVEEADALADAFTARGASALVDRAVHSTRIGFIVVTPRQPDRQTAKRLARELAQAGVHDRQVMVRGNFAERVSMGVYDAAPMALRRRDEVAALGVEAEVLERTRAQVQWWVHARLPRLPNGDDPLPHLARDVAVTPVACDTQGIRSADSSLEDGTAS